MKLEVNENSVFNTKISTPPPVIGGYRFGNHPTHYSQINFTYKPTWFHRNMMRMCLGMYWFDINTKEK
jgi:hypothetical protein